MASPSIKEIIRMGGAGDPLPGSAFGAEAMPGYTMEEIYGGVLPGKGVSAQELGQELASRGSARPTQAQQKAIRDVSGLPLPRVGTGPDGNRLTPGVTAYTEDGKPYPFNYPPNTAVAAIDTVAPANVPLPRPRPNINNGNPGSTGLFGQQMSPGMADIIATDPKYASQRSGRVVQASTSPVVQQGIQAAQSLAKNQRATPITPAQAAANQNPAAQAAIDAGRSSYTNSSTGALMPTRSIGGGPRNTYGD